MNKKVEYVTLTGLRSKRGWTDKMIREMLGDPDKTATNPHYSTAAPMKLYLVKRVEAMEQTVDMELRRKDRERRSEAGKRGAITRAANAPIRAQRISRECDLGCNFSDPLPVVIAKARDHAEEMREYHEYEYQAYVDRCLARGEEPRPRRGPAYPDVAAEDRWAVNYLRHVCSDYDYLLEDGCVIWNILRRRVHEAIGQAYPELKTAAMEML